MNTREILEKARAVIADEARWTRGSMAADRYGERVLPTDPEAVAFCAVGAVLHVAERPEIVDAGFGVYEADRDEAVRAALLALHQYETCMRAGKYHADDLDRVYCVTEHNDRCEHDDVLALFDKVLAGEGV